MATFLFLATAFPRRCLCPWGMPFACILLFFQIICPCDTQGRCFKGNCHLACGTPRSISPAVRRKEECKDNLRWKIEREVYICKNNNKAIQRKKHVFKVPVVLKKQIALVPVPVCRLQKFTSDKNFLFLRLSLLCLWGSPQKFSIIWSYFIPKSADMRRKNCTSIDEFWMGPVQHQSLKMWQDVPRDCLVCFILLLITLYHENVSFFTGLQDGFVSERSDL